MKKFYAFLGLILININACTLANAQFRGDDRSRLKISTTVFGGYNVLEDQPVGGLAVAFNAFCLRAEIELGWTKLNTYLSDKPKRFAYFNPNIGLSFGNENEFYAMVGATNFGYIMTTEVSECNSDKFLYDLFHLKTKIGGNFAVGGNFILNVELACIVPQRECAGYVYYDGLFLRVGAGYRF